MIKEETKKSIEVMQAYVDGKQIQVKLKEQEQWVDVEKNCMPCWDWVENDYRIKPEQKVRPYTYDEMCEAVKKHGILVKTKGIKEVFAIGSFDETHVFYFTDTCETYEELLKNSVWFDDNTPCGIEEE